MHQTKRIFVVVALAMTMPLGLSSCASTPLTEADATDRSQATQYEAPEDVLEDATKEPTPVRTALPSTDAGDSGELGAPEVAAPFGASEQQQALEFARASLAAFQDVGNPAWAESLKTFLAPDVQSLYATVSPDAVPVDDVLDVQLAADSTPELAVAEATTARGVIRVLMQRQQDLSWKVARFDLGGLQ